MFLVRANLADGALLATVLWWMFGASIWGVAVGRPVGACVALALGFVQCLYLIPAACFALSVIGGVWLSLAPATARAPSPPRPVWVEASRSTQS